VMIVRAIWCVGLDGTLHVTGGLLVAVINRSVALWLEEVR
jgi:hypothetical protein